jgi:hypothetical protein
VEGRCPWDKNPDKGHSEDKMFVENKKPDRERPEAKSPKQDGSDHPDPDRWKSLPRMNHRDLRGNDRETSIPPTPHVRLG